MAVASVSLLAALALLLYYFFVTNVKKEDIDMYQFKHFSWDELTKSDKAREYNISNIPGEEEKRNLIALVMKVLDIVPSPRQTVASFHIHSEGCSYL